jgi:hypothetical protein
VVAGAVITELSEYHSDMTNIINELNTSLGVELKNDLERIVRQQLDVGVDTYASRIGWRPR